MGLESTMRMCAADEQCIRRHWMFPLGRDDHIPLVHSFFPVDRTKLYSSGQRHYYHRSFDRYGYYETSRCLTPNSHDKLQSISRNNDSRSMFIAKISI